MTELKPCPECGSDFLNIMTEHTSGNRVIHCMDCHKYYYELNLTREDSRSDILSKWNEYAQNYNPAPMTEPALKPCPFCGVIPKIERKDSGIFKYRVQCRDSNEQNWYDHIEYGQVFYRTNPESLTRVWNRYVDKHLKRIERNKQSRTKVQWREME